MVKFKKTLKLPGIHKVDKDNNQLDKVKVGVGWYRNFMKRNKDKLTRQRLRVKDAKRHTYCTYANFKLMYETVYEEMVACGIAEKHDEEFYVDSDGNKVQTEQESSGNPSKTPN
jgi:hypothetical protein